MREEIRRCNSIGTKDGISYFLKKLFDDKVFSIAAMNSYCQYYSLQKLNTFAAFELLSEIGIIALEDGNARLTDLGTRITNVNASARNRLIAQAVLEYLSENKLVNFSLSHFDIRVDAICFPQQVFPLSCAVFRNFLISLGIISLDKDALLVEKEYEGLFVKHIRHSKRTITKEELLQKLQIQQDDGDLGEMFALAFENNRIKKYGKQAKRISEIDVAAGFDLVSYESELSTEFDRFIEVKAYRGKMHFYWSRNEREVATLLSDRYYLYIVNLDAINDSLYVPTIIPNPSLKLLELGWLIQPQSYYVQCTE